MRVCKRQFGEVYENDAQDFSLNPLAVLGLPSLSALE